MHYIQRFLGARKTRMRESQVRENGPDSFQSSPFGRTYAIAGALLAAGVGLWSGPWSFTSPVPPALAVPAWATDQAPVRTPRLNSQIEIAGFTYDCSDCHRLFSSPPETTRSLTQHAHIVLDHGLNNRCFNCHHRTNRDALVDDAGGEIPADRPQLLCGKCHGPVYRDWLNGAHGRTNGYWDKSKGPQERRKCIECHDPHSPSFAPMQPAPGPNTPRMGDQHFDHEAHGVPNPLRIFRQGTSTKPHGGLDHGEEHR